EEARQRLVEGLHPELLLAHLHLRVDLVDLVLADEVPDGGVRDHHLEREHAARAAGLGQQVLREDALEHERELRAHLRLLVCTALFVCSVAKARWPVSEMTSAVSIVSRSRISPMRTTSGSCLRMCL